MTDNNLYSNIPRPRLCHLRRWPDFVGYGFNLHSERNKQGQFIGKVDPDSPAESAGLREKDRIIEVNFVPIGNENHKQAVARIKEGVTRNGRKHPEEVILLVLDPEADEYYKSISYVVRSSDSNVEKIETEIRDRSESGNDSPRSSNSSIGKADSHFTRETKPNDTDRDYRHVTDFTGPTVTHTQNMSSSAISRTSDQDYEPPEDHETYHRSSPPASDKNKHQEFPSTNTYTNINSSPKSPTRDFYAKPTDINTSQSSTANGSGGLLNFEMSAAEYRAKLKAQNPRKRDIRQNQTMSMKEKHDFLDRL